jgi:predicted ATPase
MADPLLRRVERDPEFDWPDPPVFPFTLPAVAGLDTLELHPEVTFLVGENGSGKSTLLAA